jgi:hypothetical protein
MGALVNWSRLAASSRHPVPSPQPPAPSPQPPLPSPNQKAGAGCADSLTTLAEREGFEPSIPGGIRALQARALDRTMRPLHERRHYTIWRPAGQNVTGSRMTHRTGAGVPRPAEPRGSAAAAVSQDRAGGWEPASGRPRQRQGQYDLDHSATRPYRLYWQARCLSVAESPRPCQPAGPWNDVAEREGFEPSRVISPTRFRDARTQPNYATSPRGEIITQGPFSGKESDYD